MFYHSNRKQTKAEIRARKHVVEVKLAILFGGGLWNCFEPSGSVLNLDLEKLSNACSLMGCSEGV